MAGGEVLVGAGFEEWFAGAAVVGGMRAAGGEAAAGGRIGRRGDVAFGYDAAAAGVLIQ